MFTPEKIYQTQIPGQVTYTNNLGNSRGHQSIHQSQSQARIFEPYTLETVTEKYVNNPGNVKQVSYVEAPQQQINYVENPKQISYVEAPQQVNYVEAPSSQVKYVEAPQQQVKYVDAPQQQISYVEQYQEPQVIEYQDQPQLLDYQQPQVYSTVETAALIPKRRRTLDLILMNCLFVLPFIFLLICFFAGLVSFSAFSFHQENYESSINVLKYQYLNSHLAPWKNFKVIQGLACPEDYHLLNLGTFGGMNEGCICKTSNVNTHAFQKFGQEVCEAGEEHCEMFEEIDSKSLFSVYEGKSFCVQYYDHWEFVNGDICPENYSLFPGGYCIYNEDFGASTIPITRIAIQEYDHDGELPPNTIEYLKMPNHVLRLGLRIERVQKETPVVQFQLSTEAAPCCDRTKNQLATVDFELLKHQYTGCKKFGDLTEISFLIDDYQDAYRLFQKQNECAKNSRLYDSYLKYRDKFEKTFLFGLKRTPISNSNTCQKLQEEQYKLLDEKPLQINKGFKAYYIAFFIATIFLLLFWFSFLFFKNLVQCFSYPLTFEIFQIMVIVYGIGLIILAILFLPKYSYVSDSEEVSQKIIDLGCYQLDHFIEANEEFHESMDHINELGVVLIIFMIASIIYILAILVFFILRKKNPRSYPCLPPPSTAYRY